MAADGQPGLEIDNVLVAGEERTIETQILITIAWSEEVGLY